ncbi:MAG: hypothetical protein JJU45_04125 [Acidimicrobiia bacterium]|nr:hypothetical protein [Acidimicrobiia bacterium]
MLIVLASAAVTALALGWCAVLIETERRRLDKAALRLRATSQRMRDAR